MWCFYIFDYILRVRSIHFALLYHRCSKHSQELLMFVQKNPLIWEMFSFFWSVNFMVMWLGAESRGRFLKGGTVQGTLEDEWMGGRFQKSQNPIAKLLTYCSTTDCKTFITLKKVVKTSLFFFLNKTFEWHQLKSYKDIWNNKPECGAFACCGFSQFCSTDLLFNKCCDNAERVSE